MTNILNLSHWVGALSHSSLWFCSPSEHTLRDTNDRAACCFVPRVEVADKMEEVLRREGDRLLLVTTQA
jgi:hypothetical protein